MTRFIAHTSLTTEEVKQVRTMFYVIQLLNGLNYYFELLLGYRIKSSTTKAFTYNKKNFPSCFEIKLPSSSVRGRRYRAILRSCLQSGGAPISFCSLSIQGSGKRNFFEFGQKIKCIHRFKGPQVKMTSIHFKRGIQAGRRHT